MNTYTQSELFTTNELMNVFVISDHHFYHENIIKYCNRPFNSLREMNYTMIEKWNSVVSENDTVLHLGDFSFGDNTPSLFVAATRSLYVPGSIFVKPALLLNLSV